MSDRALKAEQHVHLSRQELQSSAYRSLSTDGRALLIEMRSLYNGVDNMICISRRSIEQQLGVGRWRAERARDELISRGFVRLIERQARHAHTYALINERANR